MPGRAIQNSKDPIAVLISDIHFSINTLGVASRALNEALFKAETLKVPLVIAGDLNDTKAIIRAEVANAIISIISGSPTHIYILVGNHDLVNEKGKEHGLNYLAPYASIVRDIVDVNFATLLPYQNDTETFKAKVKRVKEGSILIMHQGVQGAFMGDYIQDKTSVDPDFLGNLKVFSGHYHKHQTVGPVTYIGNPYTLSFGEANDGPKGILILHRDGSYDQVPLELRRHVIVEKSVDQIDGPVDLSEDAIIWLKLRGPLSQLKKIKKEELGRNLFNRVDFKLDLLPTENNTKDTIKLQSLSPGLIVESLIDRLEDAQEHKNTLKVLLKEIMS